MPITCLAVETPRSATPSTPHDENEANPQQGQHGRSIKGKTRPNSSANIDESGQTPEPPEAPRGTLQCRLHYRPDGHEGLQFRCPTMALCVLLSEGADGAQTHDHITRDVVSARAIDQYMQLPQSRAELLSNGWDPSVGPPAEIPAALGNGWGVLRTFSATRCRSIPISTSITAGDLNWRCRN
jgi:hypothetical protein